MKGLSLLMVSILALRNYCTALLLLLVSYSQTCYHSSGGDMRFTSKGMVDSSKPMPEGVPEGFPKMRKAIMTIQVSKKRF